MLKSTGGGWMKLSDTKKGLAAIFAAVIVGFSVGTMTVAQVGLPARVTTLEGATESVEARVTVLESDRATARLERDFIIRLLNWHTCAIEAINDAEPTRTVCGNPPQYIFRRVE